MEDNLKRAIEQMKNGEEKGFNEVYSQTYSRVYFRAKQIMKKEEDAQDLTQIVFVEAYKSIHSLQSSEALFSWLDGITYRQGMKIYRKNKDILLSEEAEGMFEALESNDLSTLPELTTDQKATSEIIRGIVEELPELQKVSVIAYYFDGLKVEQIADLMECSINTIKSRLNYARKYIKERVEEKEKREGYRLHVFGVPVLWGAIKMLSDETTLTVQAAQGIYSGACSNVGIQATTIMAAGSEAVGAANAVGIGAKFASLSTGVRTLIIAGAVAIGGTGIAGAIHLAANEKESVKEVANIDVSAEEGSLEDDLSDLIRIYKKEDKNQILYATKLSNTEYCFYAEDLKEMFAKEDETILEYMLPQNMAIHLLDIGGGTTYIYTYEDASPSTRELIDFPLENDIIVTIDYLSNILEEATSTQEAEEVIEQPVFELTKEAGRQISAFVAAAYQCNYSSVNRGDGWEIFSMSPDECLFFVKDYVGMVNFYPWGVETESPDSADLPYNWYNGQVTTQEMADFFKDGLGIEIPADYSYSFRNDGGSLKVADGRLQSTFDGRTLQVTGGEVAIVSIDENQIILTGHCVWYDPEKTEYQFTVTGIPSENPDVFGGMTITNIEISEAEDDIIGDIDISAMELTMNEMEELVVGLDIPMRSDATDKTLLEDFNNSNFKVLFPKGKFHTGYIGGITVQLEEIDFYIGCDVSIYPKFITEENPTADSFETIGKYILEPNTLEDTKEDFLRFYRIFNTETNAMMVVSLQIDKKSDYQEYGDVLTNEFIPAFEEVLKSNLN